MWTQQEIGYAVRTGAKIIPIRMDEDPTGFIQKNQALSRKKRTANQVTDDIISLIRKDERLRAKYEKLGNVEDDDDVPF